MFLPVTKNVYRWETPDPEHGEMMVGHVLLENDGYVLIDPPMVPNLLSGLSALGECKGVIVTSLNHSRGGSTLSAITKSNYYVPKHQEEQLKNQGSTSNVVFYDENTELPSGLTSVRCRTEIPVFNGFHIDEMVLLSSAGAFVGDAAHGMQSSRLAFAPEDIIPDPDMEAAKASLKALEKAVGGNKDTAFFGHGFDVVSTFGHNLNQRKKELGVE